MSSAAVMAPAPPAASIATDCFHCGLPVGEPGRYTVAVDGASRDCCCGGCRAVAQTILEGGFGAFYRDRAASTSRVAVDDDATILTVYDDPQVAAGFIESQPDGTCEATLLLEGIHCTACVWLNEQHLNWQPGVRRVWINHASHEARVNWDPHVTSPSRLLAAVRAIGYRAWPADDAHRARMARRERRTGLWRLFVAGFGMMQVMMLAWPSYIAGDGDLSPDIATLLRWASLVLTVPVLVYGAAPFLAGALRDLRLRRFGMDVPVALGIVAAFVGSTWAVVRDTGDVYFDSITMFVFFLLAARWFENAARRSAGEGLRRLARALPATAQLLLNWPSSHDTVQIPAGALQVGDHVLVAPGATIPADGMLESAATSTDESLLTGESRPRVRVRGQELTGGAINVAQPAVLRVVRVGAATRLSAIVRLAEQAQSERPPLVLLADRHAAWFIAAILVVAAATAGIWFWIDPARALPAAVAVLVVTCPCALSLATPAALAVAVGRLAREGLVTVRAAGIEALARVDHVVFDKTGTLTDGALSVLGVETFGREDETACRAMAAALEFGSAHAIAKALAVTAGTPLPPLTDVRHVVGQGVEAMGAGGQIRIGRRRFVEELGLDLPFDEADSATIVWLGDRQGMLARFRLGDRVRPDAVDTVARLRALGVRVSIASGDHRGAVGAVARRLGIDRFSAGLTPEDKRHGIAGLQARGAKILMVGDGINDAPVLAQADVSIALGGGASLAQAKADFVLDTDGLRGVADGIETARRTRRIIAQNLWWAFGYNIAAVPLAASGLLPPWLAGLGMSLSSLLVVGKAWRLRHRARKSQPPSERARAIPLRQG
ncbi:MAG: cadmium-translocating P-type ATPase [Burkholderiales bacterium]|nr:cadmium-translocating P-type ATPase [Burkholderiales bacterium]